MQQRRLCSNADIVFCTGFKAFWGDKRGVDDTVAVIFAEIAFQGCFICPGRLVKGRIPNGMNLDLKSFVMGFLLFGLVKLRDPARWIFVQ